MDDVAVALEHVDLLNGLDGLDVELLERLLQLLVVAGGPRGRALHLPPGGALATARHKRGSEHRSRYFGVVSRDHGGWSVSTYPGSRGGLVGRSGGGEAEGSRLKREGKRGGGGAAVTYRCEQ